MLTEEHFELFKQFRIKAMGDKLREMIDDASYDRFTFEEKMEMLLDAESSARRDRKIAKYVKQAGFKTPTACIEDVVYLPDRTLNKDRIARYAGCEWVENCEVMVIISKTGGGKSFLCQAFGNDFMTTPITTQNAVDLFEIMEARENLCATLIASQLEPNEWYLRIEGELMADSILNRIATGARYIDLEGPNMRDYFAKKKQVE